MKVADGKIRTILLLLLKPCICRIGLCSYLVPLWKSFEGGKVIDMVIAISPTA